MTAPAVTNYTTHHTRALNVAARYDLARLTAFDCGVLDEAKLKDEKELERLTRDNVQLVIDAIYALPMEVCLQNCCASVSTFAPRHVTLAHRPPPTATSSPCQHRPPTCPAPSPYQNPNRSLAGRSLPRRRCRCFACASTQQLAAGCPRVTLVVAAGHQQEEEREDGVGP